MNAFPDPGELQAIYPGAPGIIHHALAGHPMFTLAALVALAVRMRPDTVEYNRGDLPIGIENRAVPGNGLSVEDTIRDIEHNGSWMVLKFVEQDPGYAALMTRTLAEIDPVLRTITGPMLRQEAFIFISSPGSVTPLHFDPEHNILLQLAGTKRMTVFPAGDAAIAPIWRHEDFHTGRQHRNLPYDEHVAARGQSFDLQPGDGIHVPLMAPHWVVNGPAVSISFSVTWRSRFSYGQADAHAFNALLRRFGIIPSAPRPYPSHNGIKATCHRLLRKMGLTQTWADRRGNGRKPAAQPRR